MNWVLAKYKRPSCTKSRDASFARSILQKSLKILNLTTLHFHSSHLCKDFISALSLRHVEPTLEGMFSFFRRSSRKESTPSPQRSVRGSPEEQTRNHVTTNQEIQPTCKNKIATPENHIENVTTPAAIAETAAQLLLLTVADASPTNSAKFDSVRMQNDSFLGKSKTPPEPTPRHKGGGHNVKPCGHGTVAIAPRIPLAATKRDLNTPPESPKQEAQANKFLKSKSPLDSYMEQAFCIGGDKKVGGLKNCVVDVSSVNTNTKASAEDKEELEADDVNIAKNLINQEAQFQGQINDLSKQLAQRDGEANKLRFEMDELQRDVFTKTAGMDRLQSELNQAHTESEHIRNKLKALEGDLQEFRYKNTTLADELSSKTEIFTKAEEESTSKLQELDSVIQELKNRITNLESDLENLRLEKRQIEEKHATLLNEQEIEKQCIEASLQQALKDKLVINKKWEQEFEKLRTVNIMKEQQLLDDFEWKLREVEKTCKKRLEDKDHSIHDKLQDAYKAAAEKMKLAEDMMAEVEHLRSCETEMYKLRNLTKDQDRNMVELKDKQVQMKEAESGLREEAKKLRSLIELEKDNMQHIQRLHYQEILEKERWLKRTLNEKRCEIATFWEEKLLHECGRLKSEMEQLHNEEKVYAMDIVRRRKEDEFGEAKKTWELKMEECMAQIKALKIALQQKEKYYHHQLVEHQSNTDKEMMELRRIMDKIDMTHHDRFEKLLVEHERELEKLNDDKDKRLLDVGVYYKNEISELKITLETVKQEMENDASEKIEELIEKHRSELDTQWANLIHQKSTAIKLMEQEYSGKYQQLEDQFRTQQKSHDVREVELLKTIDQLKNDVQSKEDTMDDMQANADTLEGGVQVLNHEIAHQNELITRNRREADQKIRNLQDVLTKLQALQEQERDDMQAKLLQAQKQSNTTIEHLQRKCQCLSKLFEEVRGRYERRESRQEDLNIISDLRQVIAEQEKDLQCLNEEKRHFQMQLIKLQHSAEANNENSSNDDESEERFEDTTEDFQVHAMRRAPAFNSGPITVSNGPVNFSIPPTIIECDDDDDSDEVDEDS